MKGSLFTIFWPILFMQKIPYFNQLRGMSNLASFWPTFWYLLQYPNNFAKNYKLWGENDLKIKIKYKISSDI